MNPLLLLLIVPAVSGITALMFAFAVRAKDRDERMIALLKQQYREICGKAKIYAAGAMRYDDGILSGIISEHEAERRKIEG